MAYDNTNSGVLFSNDQKQGQQPDYRGKTLADFYDTAGAVLCDAFAAGNLVGGTPTARPEELQIHPTTGEVYVAFTLGKPGNDGTPDSRIFVTGKFTADATASQPFGGLYKILQSLH